jgi:glycosyltransferase involved in cell wall biosynthesis
VSPARRLTIVAPSGLEAPTGGNRYDAALADALEGLGVVVDRRTAAGRWPAGTEADRERLAGLLAGLAGRGPVLVDGLVACGAPDAVTAAVAGGTPVHVLVHLPLALETGLDPARSDALDALEGASLAAATGVVATSRWAGAHLRRHHRLAAVAVATPGTDPAPPAAGSTPPRLLQLASVVPRKDQLGVVAALALVRDLAWTAELAGTLDADPAYAGRVRAAIDAHGLGDRVRLAGPLAGEALAAALDAADLVLLPSRAETWGMAVSEGLARGVPAVVGRGTGAEEALGRAPCGDLPGAVVPPGEPAALAAAIRDLLGPGRERAVTAAKARRATLSSWQDTARDVLSVIS